MWNIKRKLCFPFRQRSGLPILVVFMVIIYFTLSMSLFIWSPQNSIGIPVHPQSLINEHHSSIQKAPVCQPQQNFVFIKQMKCATSTFLGTLYRFGYKRNLTFVSPVKSYLYLNWPFKMTKADFRPSSVGYNILTDHSIYTEDVMEAIMPNDTVYITMIRHPLAHVMSVFQYFKLHKVVDIPNDVNPWVTYFSDINKYESIYTSQENIKKRNCIPTGFSMTKNIMSHCLGMPLGYPPGTPDISKDANKIEEYFRHIKQKFKLVMLVEYFFESLILFKRLMCWQFSDMLFMKANIAKYSFNTSDIPQKILDIHKEWTSIDYKLYDFFNVTFWNHISEQSDDFYEEISAFKDVEKKVNDYCRSLYQLGERPAYRYPKDKGQLTIEASKWTSTFKVLPEDCWMLGPNPYKLLYVVQAENDKKEPDLLNKQSQQKDYRTLKGLC